MQFIVVCLLFFLVSLVGHLLVALLFVMCAVHHSLFTTLYGVTSSYVLVALLFIAL